MKARRAIPIACTAIALIAGAFLGIRHFWDSSPRPPDPAKMTLQQAMEFEATDDYLRLSERRRTEFSTSVVRKLEQLPFEKMLGVTLDPASIDMHRRRLANLRKLPSFDQLHSRLAADFLEKFYKLPEFKRTVYLTVLALYQELEANIDPSRYQMPDPGEFHADAVRLFSGKSPLMKAYGMQFFLDLRQQRKRMGLPDRPLPMR